MHVRFQQDQWTCVNIWNERQPQRAGQETGRGKRLLAGAPGRPVACSAAYVAVPISLNMPEGGLGPLSSLHGRICKAALRCDCLWAGGRAGAYPTALRSPRGGGSLNETLSPSYPWGPRPGCN